jgi:hypothetical protein
MAVVDGLGLRLARDTEDGTLRQRQRDCEATLMRHLRHLRRFES